MSSLHLTETHIKEGVWHGIITNAGDVTPAVDVTHRDVAVPDISLQKNDKTGAWALSVPIPPQAIADGMQTLIIRDTTADMPIGHITLMAGEVMADDIRAEVDLLRAELDMLKRAFRRHCVETG